MPIRRFFVILHVLSVALSCFFALSIAQAQGAKQVTPEAPINATDADHVRERDAWFYRGRIVAGKPSADLRRRAYHAKMQMRAQRASRAAGTAATGSAASSIGWTPLGPVPLASDASGTGVQDYHQVAGRATAVAIDPADPSGNTVYVGGAQAGVWKSTNAASSAASSVNWTAITDNQATLSVGSIAIQPGNTDLSKTLILVGTGEANSSGDSYFGLGILRSADAGNTWTLIPTANSGALSFSGLGGTRMAFSTASTVVAAMGTTSEGLVDGAVTGSTARGLYTSLDAGQSWTYDALTDAGSATDATSATSVVYNPGAGLFFAAVRYHGFYSSPDGTHWTRLANQPGSGALSTTACPPQSTSNNRTCPIYRGEITAMPGRNEMYAWYISLDSFGDPVDQFIWQSTNSGATWTQINDNGITNCGDVIGCGVEQGYYNLELQAVPNGSTATDLYAGAINLYKCSISSINPTCNTSGFMNLTHVYGCSPIAAPSHVHPDQHGLAYMIPTPGTDLMYFANDGGIYRALNGFTFTSPDSGSCSSTNAFDDLNQNLGSMTQFVSFSQHPSDADTLLGGAQDNGSPATSSVTTSTNWVNVNGGDGGFNAIDQWAPLFWYVSNPDSAPGGLNILQCSSGVSCREANLLVVVGSSDLGGDDGAFYFPYILDPQSRVGLLVGTCRVWRGPRLGGTYTDLSPNFDTFGAGACTGNEINVVRALAAGGPTDSNGSQVIYATTDGPGPLNATSPTGGHIWVTTNATAGTPAFSQVSQNLNPNQFPVSSVAIDSSDATGGTAYVTIMGFTDGTGHVWKTTDAGATWTDFTGSGAGALPDDPVNAVVVDSAAGNVYVGTDVGVFQTSTAAAAWVEVGPGSASGQAGFLPNVAVTALGIFRSGSQKLLRASTYGRGIWQWGLAPDFKIGISNAPQIIFPGQTATFKGTVTALGGYTSSITLSCAAGATNPPSSCTPKPLVLTATVNTPFTISASDVVGDYSFNAQGAGSDSSKITRTAGLVLHVVNFGLTTPSPNTINTPPGTTSSPVSFQVTASGSFNQSVTVSCTVVNIPGGSCSLTPAATVTPTSSAPVNMTASVTVPLGTATGSYTINLRATTSGAPSPLTTSFTLTVSQDFAINSSTASQTVTPGQTTSPYNLAIQPLGASFNSAVTVFCAGGLPAGALCSFNPNPVTPGNGAAAVAMTISTTSATPAGNYSLTVTGTSGSLSHSVNVALVVASTDKLPLAISQDFPSSVDAASQVTAKVTVTPNYSGAVNVTCDASALAGAICTVSPANPVPVTAGASTILTISLSVPNTAAPNPTNSYAINLTVSDSSGQPSNTLPLALNVIQDFSVNSATPGQTVTAGQTSGAYQLTIAPNPSGSSFPGAVTLSCTNGLPSGAQCKFTPNPIAPASGGPDVVMTISTAAPTGV